MPDILLTPRPDRIAWDPVLGAWAVWRHDDVVAVLTDARLSATEPREQTEAPRHPRPAQPTRRGDPRARARQQTLAALNTAAPGMRTVLENALEATLGACGDWQALDLVTEVLRPLCLAAAVDLTGLDPAHAEEAAELGEQAFRLSDLDVAGADASKGATVGLVGLLAGGMSRGHDPSGLLTAVHDRLELGPAVGLLVQLWVGVVASLPRMLGTVMLYVVADPTVATHTHELVRLAGPARAVIRVATEPMTLFGQHLPRGARVAALLAAANRDPQRWTDPDRIDSERPLQPHLAFGAGVHACLGGPLARTAVELVPPRLAAWLGPVQIAPPGPTWGGSRTIRGVENLRVRRVERDPPEQTESD